MPADYGKMFNEETHDEGRLLVEESKLRSTDRASGSYERYGSVYKNDGSSTAGLLREPGAPSATSKGGSIRRLSKASQQRIAKRLAQARRHLGTDGVIPDETTPPPPPPPPDPKPKKSKTGLAYAAISAASSMMPGDDDNEEEFVDADALGGEALSHLRSKRAGKKPKKPQTPIEFASKSDAAASASATSASETAASTGRAAGRTAGARAAGVGGAGVSAQSTAIVQSAFAQKEMERHTQRAAWRESTRRANAARQAIEGAAKSSAASKAAIEAASKGAAKTISTAAATGFGSVAALVLPLISIVMVMALAITAIIAKEEEKKVNTNNTALAEWAISEYELGKDENYWSGGERYWSNFISARDEWCSFFVGTGWKECGFEESMGIPSDVGLANSWITWVKHDESKGELIKCDENWTPKPGDICVDGEPDGESNHVGICCSEVDERGQYRMIAGNESDQVAERYLFPGSEWSWIFRPAYPDVEGDVEFGEDEQAFVDEWAPRIESWFKSKSSSAPLASYGKEFAAAAYENKVDPRLSPMISWMESSGGQRCFKSHNAWGWGSSEWGSWEEAIAAHVKGLKDMGYADMSYEDLVAKYCPDGNEATYVSNLHTWSQEF